MSPHYLFWNLQRPKNGALSQISPNWLFLSLALAAASMIVLWQWTTVTANYGGSWSALFCTGSMVRHPPLVSLEHTYVFANSTGYDGQEYHYAAHDPFLRTGLKHYIDDARLRYRRILVPLLAYTLALGRSAWIDSAYELVSLFSIGLGVYWSCRFTMEAGLSPYWGLLFLMFPAIPITVDRMVIDGALAALTVGFLVYANQTPSWKIVAILACAAVTRETGFLLILAYSVSLVSHRDFRHAWIALLSAVPALAWCCYVQANTQAQPYAASFVPLSAIVRVLTHPWTYPASIPLVGAVLTADYLALFGVILAFALAFVVFIRFPAGPIQAAAVLFAAMGVVLQRTDHWQNVYDFGRVYTPLLLLLASLAVRQRKLWLLVPVALMLPRIAAQFVPQVLGIVRWIG